MFLSVIVSECSYISTCCFSKLPL